MKFNIKNALEAIKENYIDYSKYVVRTRAYPSLVDGCKAIHRRIIDTCYKNLPKKHLVKSPNAIGEIVKLHPHPSAIYPVLASMASPIDCPFPLFDIEGNFGGNGFAPAAERYTSLGLSELAGKIFEQFSTSVDMIEGEMDKNEPANLATFLPLSFLMGSYGIPVGMSTVNIPALNPLDIIAYCIEVLKTGDLTAKPDVLVKPNVGNVYVKSSKSDWQKMLSRGLGKIAYAPKIEVQEKSLIISGVPSGKDFKNVLDILAPEIEKDQIDARDETDKNGLCFVVEILPYKKVNINSLAKRLTDKLTVNESYRFIFADDGVAVHAGFQTAMSYTLSYLQTCCLRWIDKEIVSLDGVIKILSIIEQMKKDGALMKLPTFDRSQAISYIMTTYEASEEIAKTVLSKPLSYLTKEHAQEIKEYKDNLKLFKERRKDVNGYLIEQYEALIPEVKKVLKNKEMTTFLTKKAPGRLFAATS